MTEGYSIGSPIRVHKSNYKGGSDLFSLKKMSTSNHQIDEGEEESKEVEEKVRTINNGKEYLKSRTIKKGCPKLVKMADMHLYKNQKEESRGLSFDIYSNGRHGSTKMAD